MLGMPPPALGAPEGRAQGLPPPNPPQRRMEEASLYRTRPPSKSGAIREADRVVAIATPKGLFATGGQVAGVSARSREIPPRMREEKSDVPGAESLSPVP